MSVDGSTEQVASLRGAKVAGSGRRVGQIALGSFLVICAVLLVVGFVSAGNDQARSSRLRTSGVPVTVTVTSASATSAAAAQTGRATPATAATRSKAPATTR